MQSRDRSSAGKKIYSRYSMKMMLAILATTVVLAAVSGSEAAPWDSHTYISNWSTRSIRASISYQVGTSKFRERLIEPYSWDVDEYWDGPSAVVTIEIWIEGNPSHGWIRLIPGRSIVAFDNGAAIDIYLATYGKLTQIDPEQPQILTTIYPW